MEYREQAVPGALCELVDTMWIFSVGHDTGATNHVIVPDGMVSLACALLPDTPPILTIVGPALKAHRRPLTPGAVYCGLRPGVAGSLLRRDIAGLTGNIVPIDQVLPDQPLPSLPLPDLQRRDADEATRALEEIVSMLAETAAPLDREVIGLARTIADRDGDVVLKDLVASGETGPRQLRRRFAYQCGLSAKAFARLRRVRRACFGLVIERVSQASAATGSAGFADQAHMSREFRDIFGGSPALVTEYLSQISHFALANHGQGR